MLTIFKDKVVLSGHSFKGEAASLQEGGAIMDYISEIDLGQWYGTVILYYADGQLVHAVIKNGDGYYLYNDSAIQVEYKEGWINIYRASLIRPALKYFIGKVST